MGAAGFGIMLAACAAFVALWIDIRWAERRPESPMRRMGHSFAAYGVVQLAAVATVHLGGEGTTLGQRVAVLFLLFTPALVYAFLAGIWVLRTLADAAGLARR
jgi:uncharacterized MAPEG superfamily protein